MNQNRPALLRKILNFVLDIGADPADSEYTRLIKRIYYVSAVFGILASLATTIWYSLSGNAGMAWGYLVSFALFLGTTIDGYLHPRHFAGIVLVVLAYFVLASAFATVLLGGIWRTEGQIIAGLMGPLLGLVFFPRRRWAVALFLAYAMLVLGLAVREARSVDAAAAFAEMDQVLFWLGFLIIAVFIFGVVYFFVVQRDKAHRLLAEEKEKSERLLRRIEADLEQAARIQKDLLPKSDPRIEGFDIGGVNIPCYEVGGDYYDFVAIDADRLGVVIADVAGKGIGAALLMASLRAALLAEIHPAYDLGKAAARLNEFVFKSSGPASFVTFFLAEVDRRTAGLRYINAGHNPPFIMGRDGRARALESSGFPLGMFSGAAYEVRSVSLEPGELAVLFTDGVPEGRNARGEDYSEGRLKAVVLENRALPAAAICRKVIEDVGGYACETEPCDDMTLVVVKKTGPAIKQAI